MTSPTTEKSALVTPRFLLSAGEPNSPRLLLLLIILANFVGYFGCSYSFSGASVPPHLKTIAIPYTEDKSGSGEPGLREKFTRVLTQKFIEDNNLKIAERTAANAVLETAFVAISDVPAVVSAGENVSAMRVNLSVQVAYKDIVKKKIIFEKQFNNYADYATSSGRTGRDAAIESAIDKITDDILLDTVSGW